MSPVQQDDRAPPLRRATRDALPGNGWCKPVCKPDSVPTRGWGTAIHLGCRLPGTSCGLTRDLGRAAPGRRGVRPCSTLLRAGFTWPAGHPTAGGLLPHHFTVAATAGAVAVSFLWHSPSGHPDWALPSALLCGVRTFLRRRTTRGRPTGLPVECTSGVARPRSPVRRAPSQLPRLGAPDPLGGEAVSGPIDGRTSVLIDALDQPE
jgi:hypothetical protein